MRATAYDQPEQVASISAIGGFCSIHLQYAVMNKFTPAMCSGQYMTDAFMHLLIFYKACLIFSTGLRLVLAGSLR
jgi:hypothetical protein